MLVGKIKRTPEERARLEMCRLALHEGKLMIVKESEYHEDDETPSGFLERGDVVMLVRSHPTPVVNSKREIVYYVNNWDVLSRWGLIEKSDGYLSQCCVPYNP